ncbi:hypothetical protein FVO62_RS27575, partial [Escherichia coli]|nr:hypothetical protein [Escherichia coli]
DFMVTASVIFAALFVLAALTTMEAAVWVTAVAAIVSGFYIGYEAWNNPEACTVFCGVVSQRQGVIIMAASAFAGIVVIGALIRSIIKSVRSERY